MYLYYVRARVHLLPNQNPQKMHFLHAQLLVGIVMTVCEPNFFC